MKSETTAIAPYIRTEPLPEEILADKYLEGISKILEQRNSKESHFIRIGEAGILLYLGRILIGFQDNKSRNVWFSRHVAHDPNHLKILEGFNWTKATPLIRYADFENKFFEWFLGEMKAIVDLNNGNVP